jgi:hypothetical protein
MIKVDRMSFLVNRSVHRDCIAVWRHHLVEKSPIKVIWKNVNRFWSIFILYFVIDYWRKASHSVDQCRSRSRLHRSRSFYTTFISLLLSVSNRVSLCSTSLIDCRCMGLWDLWRVETYRGCIIDTSLFPVLRRCFWVVFFDICSFCQGFCIFSTLYI